MHSDSNDTRLSHDQWQEGLRRLHRMRGDPSFTRAFYDRPRKDGPVGAGRDKQAAPFGKALADRLQFDPRKVVLPQTDLLLPSPAARRSRLRIRLVREESGLVIPLVACAFAILAPGAIAYTMDRGSLALHRERLNTAVQAAALAAAQEADDRQQASYYASSVFVANVGRTDVPLSLSWDGDTVRASSRWEWDAPVPIPKADRLEVEAHAVAVPRDSGIGSRLIDAP